MPRPHGASAERSGPDTDVLRAIDTVTATNRARPNPDLEAQLLLLRASAFEHMNRLPRPRPTAVIDLFADAPTPPELAAQALTVEAARSGILHHGSLLVRGLVPRPAVDRLVADLDRAFDAARAHQRGAPISQTAPWYVPFVPTSGEAVAVDRTLVETRDGLLAADSPRTMFDLIDIYQEAGLRDFLTEYLGDRPALSVKKTTLRRVGAETETQWWHQDGAFLGQVGSLNIWLSLSDCGEDAPSLDLVSKRVDEILPTGVEGADFEWSLGQAVVDRCADGAFARPVFRPGDALFFDEMLVHRTGASPGMTGIRYAIESWFFAPSAFPHDRIPLVF
jgi:hypothetical protein